MRAYVCSFRAYHVRSLEILETIMNYLHNDISSPNFFKYKWHFLSLQVRVIRKKEKALI